MKRERVHGRKHILSLPDFVFYRLAEFIDINPLLDCCHHFSRLKSALYCLCLNDEQTLVYYYAHCKDSYVQCRVTKKYYLTTYGCANMHSAYRRQRARPKRRIYGMSEARLAYYRTIHRVKVTLFDDCDRCFHAIYKHIGAYIVALHTNMDVVEFAPDLPHLTALYMYGGDEILDATLDVRALRSLEHVTIEFRPISLLCTTLSSLTTFGPGVVVFADRASIKNFYIYDAHYDDILPNRSSCAPFENIYFFTEILALSDVYAFHTKTYVVLYEDEYHKILTYVPSIYFTALFFFFFIACPTFFFSWLLPEKKIAGRTSSLCVTLGLVFVSGTRLRRAGRRPTASSR